MPTVDAAAKFFVIGGFRPTSTPGVPSAFDPPFPVAMVPVPASLSTCKGEWIVPPAAESRFKKRAAPEQAPPTR